MNMTQFNRIVEIRTKIISLGTYLSATLYAVYRTGEFSLFRFLLMITAVICIDMGTTGFNSYFDYVRGTDRAERNYEADKVLVHEGISPSAALLISLSLFGAAALTGLIIAYLTSYYLILAGGACMAIGFLYTGGPLPISRTPLGELFAGGFLGTALFTISYYVLTLNVSAASALISLPFMFLIGMILTVNNSCDRESDKEAGRKTLSILLSIRANRRVLLFQLTGAFILTLAFALLGMLPPAVFFTLPAGALFSFKVFRKMEKEGFSLKSKSNSMRSVSNIFLSYTLAFSSALVLSMLF